jgi:hypothetical protein
MMTNGVLDRFMGAYELMAMLAWSWTENELIRMCMLCTTVDTTLI